MERSYFDRQTRESSIELLKIAAIILIIISHIVQTIRSENPDITFQDYVLNLAASTTNIQYIILNIFAYFGAWGNNIFFVCSAWFLLRSPKCNKRKCFFMLIEIWVISVAILIITYIIGHGNISKKIIVYSLFPTTFSNNWYLTCYLLFYLIHPFLNDIIWNMSKQSLFRISAFMFILYFGFNFIKNDLFFPSFIILWITIYFVMAYMQLYCKNFADNIHHNIILLAFGLAGFIGIALVTNFMGLHISFFEDKILYWVVTWNPFLLISSIAMFNLMRGVHFKSPFINYVSKLSLLIYIIHENIILRTYYRPYMVNYIYENFGYANIVLWVFALAVVIFVFAVMCAMIYVMTVQKIVLKTSNALYIFLRKLYLIIEQSMLKFH